MGARGDRRRRRWTICCSRRLAADHRPAGGTLIDRDHGGRCPRSLDLVARLDGTTLCIQGPPGTGKTYTAAAVIVELLRQGKRIGVTATATR